MPAQITISFFVRDALLERREKFGQKNISEISCDECKASCCAICTKQASVFGYLCSQVWNQAQLKKYNWLIVDHMLL
jgi:hypothetical protein